MLAPEVMIQAHAQFPMLKSLAPSLLEQFQREASLAEFKKDQSIFSPGESCRGYPMVLSGSIRVFSADTSGRELNLYRVGPGSTCVVTTACLLNSEEYHAFGRAESSGEMIFLGAKLFTNLVEASREFRQLVFAVFSDRLNQLMELVEAVTFRRLDQRLAKLLVGAGVPVVAKTHQRLADELGTSREIISRLLKRFAEEDWVELQREEIRIKDHKHLELLAN